MEPKIVELGAFTVVGLRYFGENKNQEVAQLWGEFNGKYNMVNHRKADSPFIGLCIMEPCTSDKFEFEYVSGLMVDSTADMNPSFVSRDVPASKYAVFTHKGPLTTLMGTYQYIFGDWASKTEYKVDEHLNFEWYDDRFKDNDPTSEFDIYVPIK